MLVVLKNVNIFYKMFLRLIFLSTKMNRFVIRRKVITTKLFQKKTSHPSFFGQTDEKTLAKFAFVHWLLFDRSFSV